MKKEFVPYEQALDLKELGFDEQCLALYDLDGKITIEFVNWKNAINRKDNYLISAPLYQQAFMFFREKYKLNSTLLPIENKWYFLISKTGETLTLNRPRQCYRDTYEEAELACLNKLIEIVKQHGK